MSGSGRYPSLLVGEVELSDRDLGGRFGIAAFRDFGLVDDADTEMEPFRFQRPFGDGLHLTQQAHPAFVHDIGDAVARQ